jgi:hypothetical protein
MNSILEYNDIWGNLDGSHSGGVLPSPLNIHKDPYFAVNGYWFGETWIDEQADYHLKSMEGRWDPVLDYWTIDNVHSPCIDAGSLDFPGDFEPVPEPNGVTYYAVICGIADYIGNANDLNFTDDDAIDFRNALLIRPNWNDNNIRMLIDQAATKNNIHSAIQNIAEVADEDDVFVFFFSGHGTTGPDVPPYDETDGLDEYLCTVNGEDISDDELGDWLKALPTQNYTVLLGSCFSGGHALGDAAVLGLGTAVSAPGDGFAADLVPGPSDPDQPVPLDLDDNGYGVVLTAADEGEFAWETSEFENTVFVYYLLEAMANTGDVDTDLNEWISAEEFFTYIKPRATAWAESKGFYDTQHAQIYDGHPGELDFLDIANGSLNTSLNIVNEISYVEPNPNGGKINIGAYGGTEHASKSTSGVEAPICVNRPDMDFTGDCRVGLADFAVFTQSWLTCGLDMQEACWE